MTKTRGALIGLLIVALVAAWTAVTVWRFPALPTPVATGPGPVPVSPSIAPPTSSPRPTWPGYTSPDRQSGITSDAKPAGFVDPPPGNGLQRYADQRVTWTTCGDQECAKVIVPLNWDEPDGQAITLEMLRVKSRQGGLGPLFVNPGGPGGSAQNYAADFKADTYPGYDIVGLDPRGSGGSTPVVCGTTAQTDAYFAVDNSPDDEDEYARFVTANREFAKLCREHSGALLDHISTIDNARDMDLVRQLLGAPKLNFLGVSYGTYIGAVYAEFFPDHVGRLVLDAAVNITDNQSVIQAQGFDLTFNKFVSWCAAQADCPFGTRDDEVKATIIDFVNRLDAKPLKVGKRVLTQTLASMGIAAFLYGDEGLYPRLRDVISAATRGDGSALLSASDALTGRGSNGEYESITFAFPGIGCLDSSDKGLAEARQRWQGDREKAPIYGFWFGPSVTCEVWTAKPVPPYKLIGKGAAPIMVVGSTGDSATPYQQAVEMAAQLDSGFLVTYDGVGHGAVSSDNACIRKAVNEYLLSGTVPAKGLVCK